MRSKRSRRPIAVVLVLLCAGILIANERVMPGAGGTVSIGSQQGRMDELPAAWGDLDTWSRYIPATDETEVGLGLKPAGPNASMLIAFSARLKGAAPSQAPGEIFVHASAGVQGRHRSNTLKFVLKPSSTNVRQPAASNGNNAPVIDLSSRLGADDGSPGARVNFATATIASTEFLRIARSGEPAATVLGVDVTFRPDQMRAIRAFASRIFLKVGEPR
jgi:hypothetical protein